MSDRRANLGHFMLHITAVDAARSLQLPWWRWEAAIFPARDTKGEVGCAQLLALDSNGNPVRDDMLSVEHLWNKPECGVASATTSGDWREWSCPKCELSVWLPYTAAPGCMRRGHAVVREVPQ